MTSFRQRNPGIHGGSKYANTGAPSAGIPSRAIHVVSFRAASPSGPCCPPRNRRTATVVGSVRLNSTPGTDGAGGASKSSGRTNAIRPLVVPRSVIKTGVVMAILVSEALPLEI